METELAWAAGFFDGEGSICAWHSVNTTTVTLEVGQVSRIPLDRFQKAVAIGSVNGPYKGKSGRKDFYKWVTNGPKNVGDVVEKLLPYLCEPKRTQIWEAFVKLQMLKDQPK